MFIRNLIAATVCAAAGAATLAGLARAEERLPILVPLTSFIALEGTSQRNGALLAFGEYSPAPAAPQVLDTGSSPQIATQAWARALRAGVAKDGAAGVWAVLGPIDGNSMLALLPLARRAGVPILTVSGTAKLTEQGNPFVFRFFPSDKVVKRAQARYTVEELGRKKVALVVQTTAYGQSGSQHLKEAFAALGAEVVTEATVSPRTRELLPIIANIRRSGADVVVLQLHSGSTALFIRQARRFGLSLPIVAGSAMHQPSTAALLSPAELKGVCAETASSPVSGGSPGIEAFAAKFRKRFGKAPDAFALADYDAAMLLLHLRRTGTKTAAAMRARLATVTWKGVAMTYRSDGKGNMAHDALIVCYDGQTRVPAIVKRYAGAPKGGK